MPDLQAVTEAAAAPGAPEVLGHPVAAEAPQEEALGPIVPPGGPQAAPLGHPAVPGPCQLITIVELVGETPEVGVTLEVPMEVGAETVFSEEVEQASLAGAEKDSSAGAASLAEDPEVATVQVG